MRVDATPLFLWLVVQWLGIVTSAAGWTWTTRPAMSVESTATLRLLGVQVAASSLCFPWLLRSWRSSFTATVVSLPILTLASWLTMAGGGVDVALHWARSATYLTVWLLFLRVCEMTFAEVTPAGLRVACVTLLLTFGPAAVWGLALSAGTSHEARWLRYTPLLSASADGTLIGYDRDSVTILTLLVLLVIIFFVVCLQVARRVGRMFPGYLHLVHSRDSIGS